MGYTQGDANRASRVPCLLSREGFTNVGVGQKQPSQPVGCDSFEGLLLTHSQGSHVNYSAYQILTLQLITVANLLGRGSLQHEELY